MLVFNFPMLSSTSFCHGRKNDLLVGILKHNLDAKEEIIARGKPLQYLCVSLDGGTFGHVRLRKELHSECCSPGGDCWGHAVTRDSGAAIKTRVLTVKEECGCLPTLLV